ncbi:hypothetical protein ACH5RR_008580 [Cinchona calisaya]|uniref:Zinc knuckle CX2CX4HX4C domain-containing protein n=1 Tax=Cinchona calisaya TaxID=153742 RepID=A0ABD3ACG8_9GENT
MNGVDKWVEFKYEKCPEFCYASGKVGHSFKNCSEQPDVRNSGHQHYGSLMRSGFPRSLTKKKDDLSWKNVNRGREAEVGGSQPGFNGKEVDLEKAANLKLNGRGMLGEAKIQTPKMHQGLSYQGRTEGME